MQPANNEIPIIDDKPTFLTSIDIYGSRKTTPSILDFDHREELENVFLPLASCQIKGILLWFSATDIQSTALRGIKVDFRKVNEKSDFESLDYVAEKAKDSDKEPDLLLFEPGEYIKSITTTISESHGYIAALEFTTTMKNKKHISFGVPTVDNQVNQQAQAPPGKKVTIDFAKEGGYLVGFYGQYDGEYITHLGGYVAPFKHIQYYIRRPYIIGYKMLSKNKDILEEVSKKLQIERDEVGRIKDPKLSDKSSRVFYYLCETAANNYDLFRHVIDYLA
jgi:hypothetical protein